MPGVRAGTGNLERRSQSNAGGVRLFNLKELKGKKIAQSLKPFGSVLAFRLQQTGRNKMSILPKGFKPNSKLAQSKNKSNDFCNFLQTPNVICDARFHCRGHAQRLMNAAKIVVHKMQGERQLVIFKFLAECVCCPFKYNDQTF